MVAAIAALMLQKNPALVQARVESILTSTALPIPDSSSVAILDNTVVTTVTWDTSCGGDARDPVGAGLMQADGAVAVVPAP